MFFVKGIEMEEKAFYNSNGVTVTNARFIVSGQTYAMSGVTSVKTGVEDPSRSGPIWLGIIGGVTFRYNWQIGVALIALAIFWWFCQKPTLSVVLSSSSGEMQALSSKDATYIRAVVEALNNSIIHRG
jgi:hypothetical protein